MNGYAGTRTSYGHQEGLGLLDEKNFSDADSESGQADVNSRFKVPQWTDDAKDSVDYLRSIPRQNWKAFLLRAGLFLLPSFVQSRIVRHAPRTEKITPTSYLDGMRGLAALFVFFCHYSYHAFLIAEGWGAGPRNTNYLKLPIIRLFYQGPPAVCLFFVISGYALSYKPMKLIRSGKMADFASTMSSMTFRRFIRLYLPTMISTMIVLILLRCGIFEMTRQFANDKTYMKNVVEHHAQRFETTPKQLRHWAWDMFQFVHVFSWDLYGGSTGYDPHLWTIPVEFRCSLYLFITTIGVARLRTWARLTVMSMIMAFVYRNQRWELLLFYFGMILAELDHMRCAHIPQPALPSYKQSRPSNKLQAFGWFALSFFGLYLLSQPDARGSVTPGWVWLHQMIPSWWQAQPYRYWQSGGAMIFVLCVTRSPSWQKVFNHPAILYLGKISYAMYLVHGPVSHTVGYLAERWAYSITGIEGLWYNAGFALGACIGIPAVIWAADIFWRLFDMPSVKFARWLETQCISKEH